MSILFILTSINVGGVFGYLANGVVGVVEDDDLGVAVEGLRQLVPVQLPVVARHNTRSLRLTIHNIR